MTRWIGLVCLAICLLQGLAHAADDNLIPQGNLEQHDGNTPAGFQLSGAAEYRYLGERRDNASNGVALTSTKLAGEVTATVGPIDPKAGKWFRFTFRGLPQQNFAVKNDDLYIKVAFFGDHGKTSYDYKEKKIYDQVELARKDLATNGLRKVRGAEVWQTYQLDFMLPFPQVDTIRISVGFGHGAAEKNSDAAFLVDELKLVRITPPAAAEQIPQQPSAITPRGKLLPIGGRWFYDAADGETAIPKTFNSANADRLIYKDAVYSAPFAGNTSATLRPGFKLLDGSVVKQEKLLADNVTISFDATAMIVHTHGFPNHPTGVFPEQGFGNPSYIGEQNSTYYFPLTPKESAKQTVTDTTNSNRALHMGPIGLAVNGVVFFNPFDMGNADATDLMDRCCGHPNQNDQYHYHKYPICINSPWADEGKAHSPLLGWAFDGVPVYGPYESAEVMAKDIKGEHALNGLNAHYDEQRGWHYHVTPGRFPYLIGGFWGVEESRNRQRPGGGMGGPGGRGGPDGQQGGPGGPGGQNGGRRRPPMGPPPPPPDQQP